LCKGSKHKVTYTIEHRIDSKLTVQHKKWSLPAHC